MIRKLQIEIIMLYYKIYIRKFIIYMFITLHLFYLKQKIVNCLACFKIIEILLYTLVKTN